MIFVVLQCERRPWMAPMPVDAHGPFGSGTEATEWGSRQDWSVHDWLAIPVSPVRVTSGE